MFGHLKGQRNVNEMQDLNVQAAVSSRFYCEMQESEHHRERQDSCLLLTIGKNQVVESVQASLKKWMVQIMQVHQPSCK